MHTFSRILSVMMDAQALMTQVIPVLVQSGWQVVQSFDLQAARMSHRECACPHHGTNQCTCQMGVYLVYSIHGDAGDEPAALIVHGRDGFTELALADTPAWNIETSLAFSIRQAIDIPGMLLPGEVVFWEDETAA